MTRFEWWDGGDAYGVPADTWRQQLLPEGGLLFVLDDDGNLLLAQSAAPTPGLVPLNEENLDEWRDALEAVVNPPAVDAPSDSTAVTRAEYEKLLATVDDLTNMVLDF